MQKTIGKHQNYAGFSLIELLIVVTIIGIIASIAIPSLIRARVSANESATLGDMRALISAQAAYQSANSGFYDSALSCLTDPSNAGCIPSYPTFGPTFLDSQLSSLQAKSGYNRTFQGGAVVAVAAASATATAAYRYDATPVVVGQTGVRGFAADFTGRICSTADGASVGGGGSVLPGTCADLR